MEIVSNHGCNYRWKRKSVQLIACTDTSLGIDLWVKAEFSSSSSSSYEFEDSICDEIGKLGFVCAGYVLGGRE